ncbi:MAG: NUDIX hydrolase [Gammaproteobacteria bacterium]|nr:MAG: NUDIX hydrolase [Gammaproteobacteria bacterium]RLA24013.1 MAG: NUDIX hydrolase [Gammaproteobacteria bacterium]
MLDELLSVVDEGDRVIGQMGRGEIHRLGLRHRSVHLLVFNQAGELLLQKRSMTKDSCPGYWDSSAAGHVEAGESYDQCVMREVTEELGVVLKELPSEICKLSPSKDNGMEFCQAYQVVYEGPFIPEEGEVDELCWFSADELATWLGEGGDNLTRSVKMILAQLKK